MFVKKPCFLRLFANLKAIFFAFVVGLIFVFPARADILDAFDLAPFVPLVLESMMNVATILYKFFVGNGTGFVYICVYFFIGYSIALYLVKMHLPKDWLSFLGFSGGGEMWDGSTDAWKITENVLKPCFRGIIAATLLLQIKPVYVTDWLVNPFLEFGSLYTEQILQNMNNLDVSEINAPACEASVYSQEWINKKSCEFLVKPVDIISKENNKVIRYGFKFLALGVVQITNLVPIEGLLNIITGFVLLMAFISSNVFMALLIIQAIFDFCLSLIMYPFNVLVYVAKKSDKWFDIMPAFGQIIDSLKNLIITMIACAFILCINVALVRALFNWSPSVFGAGETPNITSNVMNFGEHSILWISAILTFFLIKSTFEITKQKLDLYTKNPKPKLYDMVTGDAKIAWDKITSAPGTIKKVWNAGKQLTNKK